MFRGLKICVAYFGFLEVYYSGQKSINGFPYFLAHFGGFDFDLFPVEY
jgi:hypothetical protein